MTHPAVVVAATVLLIALSAFFVIIEFALLGARPHRLEADAAHSRRSRAALRGVHELTMMLAAAQLGITACTFALGAVTKPAVDAWLGPVLSSLGLPAGVAGGAAFALSLLVVTFLHLVVGEMAPKSWAIAHPETAARLIALPSRGFVLLVRPLLLFVNGVANRLVAASGVTPVDRAAVGGQDVDTIRRLVDTSASAGTLDARYHPQLTAALDLERLTLGDLVDPARPIVAVPAAATVGEVQDLAARTRHLRILVGSEPGSTLRVVHVRDTLLDAPGSPAAERARAATLLPEGTVVHEALRHLRDRQEQLTVVTGGDGPVGVVTLADLLRRILPVDVDALPAREGVRRRDADRP